MSLLGGSLTNAPPENVTPSFSTSSPPLALILGDPHSKYFPVSSSLLSTLHACSKTLPPSFCSVLSISSNLAARDALSGAVDVLFRESLFPSPSFLPLPSDFSPQSPLPNFVVSGRPPHFFYPLLKLNISPSPFFFRMILSLYGSVIL